MAKFSAKAGVNIGGAGHAECGLEYDCNAQKGAGKCSACQRTISPQVIMMGKRSRGDHCFINETIRAEPSSLYNERHYHFPASLNDAGNYVITSVMVCDDWKDGTGGVVTLESGGVGQDHVRVKVQSQYRRGYRFLIAIYGKQVR